MARGTPHKFLILRTRMHWSVRRCTVATAKTQPEDYMKISEMRARDFQTWHGLCEG